MELSIIIPIYNAEKYIDDCLSSIVHENLPYGVEVLLINDGSTDESSEICRKWASVYTNIRYISQLNSGVSAARNVGINMAKGDYITFVDADDYVSTRYFDIILPLLSRKLDLIIFDHYKQAESGAFTYKRLLIQNEKRNEDLRVLPLTWRSNQVWDKIYRKAIIDEYDIRFSVEMKTSEDLIFVLKYFSYVNCWTYINQGLYYYRYVSTSAVHQFKPEYINDLSIVREKCDEYIEENHIQNYRKVFYKILLWQYIDLIANCLNIDELKIQLYRDNSFLTICKSRPITVMQRIYQLLFRLHFVSSAKIIYLLSTQFRKRTSTLEMKKIIEGNTWKRF